MKIAFYLVLVLTMASAEAFAAPAAGKGSDYIPWVTISFQALNIFVVIVGLIYFLKKPVSEFFEQRRENYKEAAQKAMQARAAAEAANREIKERLEKLDRNEQQSLEKSKVEAAALHEKIVNDAHEVASRVERDSQRMIQAELEKAKTSLRNEVIDKAFIAAEQALRERMNEQEQQRLQGEFVNKIQVARS